MYNDYGYKGSLSESIKSIGCGWAQTPNGSISFHSGTSDSTKSSFYPNYKKEENNMSIAYTQITKDGIIMLSDSRSTIYNDGVNIKSFDSYQKIFYSNRYRMGIIQTGVNTFGKRNFVELTEIIETMSKDELDFVQRLNQEFLYYAQKFNQTVNVCYAHYVINIEGNLQPEIIGYDINDSLGIYESVRSKLIGKACMSGAKWAVDYLNADRSRIQDNSISAVQSVYIKSVIEKMIDFDNSVSAKATIGGKVQTLIIYPTKMVQN